MESNNNNISNNKSTFAQYQHVAISINNLIASEFTKLQELDINQKPYQQAHELLDQLLFLLYGERYNQHQQYLKEMEQKKQKQDFEKKWDFYQSYHQPSTLVEGAQFCQQVYVLLQQLEECMKKCMSELGSGFSYQSNLGDCKPDLAENLVWSDDGQAVFIDLVMLAEYASPYFDDIGKNLMLLKTLWKSDNSLAIRLCAWPVLGQTQGISRWLMYMAHKELKIYELQIQNQAVNWTVLLNRGVIENRETYWCNVNYVIDLVKVIKSSSSFILSDTLAHVIWFAHSPSEQILYGPYHPYQGSIYGKYQQLGGWEPLKQYVWARNPLLSQVYEDNTEYFSSYGQDSPYISLLRLILDTRRKFEHPVYSNNPFQYTINQIVEWLLFANIPPTPANQEWLEWRVEVRKFVETLSDNFEFTQIPAIMALLRNKSSFRRWISRNEYEDQSHIWVNELQNLLHQAKQTDPLLNADSLYEMWSNAVWEEVTDKQQEKLAKSLIELRAKLLAAPYQYGEAGRYLEVLKGAKSHWFYDN